MGKVTQGVAHVPFGQTSNHACKNQAPSHDGSSTISWSRGSLIVTKGGGQRWSTSSNSATGLMWTLPGSSCCACDSSGKLVWSQQQLVPAAATRSSAVPPKPRNAKAVVSAGGLPEPVVRCVAAAKERGVEVTPVIFEEAVPTAQAAADRLGVTTAQIINSLVFELKSSKTDRKPILVCAAGDRRIDTRKLAALLGVSKNKVEFVVG